MKKSILTVAMLIAVMSIKAQTTINTDGVEVFHVDSLFEDKSSLLLTCRVIEVPDHFSACLSYCIRCGRVGCWNAKSLANEFAFFNINKSAFYTGRAYIYA